MDLPPLNPIIHQATRLSILALLFRNRNASFTWVRDSLGLTDGNLDTHSTRLEGQGYIQCGRVLTTRGFQVRMSITPKGDVAFRDYLEALRGYLQSTSGAEMGITAAEGPPPEGPPVDDG